MPYLHLRIIKTSNCCTSATLEGHKTQDFKCVCMHVNYMWREDSFICWCWILCSAHPCCLPHLDLSPPSTHQLIYHPDPRWAQHSVIIAICAISRRYHEDESQPVVSLPSGSNAFPPLSIYCYPSIPYHPLTPPSSDYTVFPLLARDGNAIKSCCLAPASWLPPLCIAFFLVLSCPFPETSAPCSCMALLTYQ